MKELKPEDMMGNKAAASKMRTDVIDHLIGVKTASYKSFQMDSRDTKTKQLADFELKMDTHKNETPYDMQIEPRNTESTIISAEERKEKAYSYVDAFVPGYSKAGKWYHKVGAALGSTRSKEAIKRAKRHHLVNHVASEGGKVVESMHPEVDPKLIRVGASVTAMGVNAGMDKGANYLAKKKAEKDALKKDLN